MDRNERLRKLLLDKPEIPKESYNEFDEYEPRNILAKHVNPLLDKYVNPAVSKAVQEVNKVSPVQFQENINIPKVSKGEAMEYIRDMPENFAMGFSGGISKVGNAALQGLKQQLAKEPNVMSKRQAIEAFLETPGLSDEAFDSAEKMKRMMIGRQNTEKLQSMKPEVKLKNQMAEETPDTVMLKQDEVDDLIKRFNLRRLEEESLKAGKDTGSRDVLSEMFSKQNEFESKLNQLRGKDYESRFKNIIDPVDDSTAVVKKKKFFEED